ncbi:MAG: aminotransferase class I/II-fold pyridoxal phosphate-dependent enzyme [Bacteroidetes bacterium]|nr:aminotransferase class I/II-fold pyridoxal phosphate-dependent enzyme [Bacteroidota bacterium]
MVNTKEKIWLSSPHMSGKEMKYIEEAFSNNHVFPLGPNVSGLENDIKYYVGTDNCTCLSSGTAAIHLALILLGIKHGDEVICSSFTFSASANPIVYEKAIPVFVDSEEETWNMDPQLLRVAIENRINNTGNKPKAIILVHLYGMPAKLDELVAIANEFEIPIIEDAAEALGSTYKGRHCGTFGEIGIYSFNGNKIITTSGGGALVSYKKEYCQKALFLATQARDSAPHYQHSYIGYNYRMSNISAGIGRGQMEVLDERVTKRREHFDFYKSAFTSFDGIEFLQEPSADFFSNHWLTTLLVHPEKTRGINRENIRLGLEANQVETRPLWKPMHLQPIFKHYPAYLNGVSERLFENGLCLPSSSNMTDDERDYVANSIKSLL